MQKLTDLEETLENAERKCSLRGKKLTRKRKQVLRALVETKAALSAYELVSLCNKNTSKPMPPMSVYRILEFLRVEQLAHKLETANKYIACIHITCKHKHGKSQFLICNDCHRVEEVDVPSEALSSVEAAANKADFKLLNTQLEVSGVCNMCAVRN